MGIVADRERLVAALRERGVDWLAPGDAAGEPLPDEALMAGLAASKDARLRQSLIALFLLNPRLAPLAREIRPGLAPAAETELLVHYTAAVYLQRMWRVRLGHYLLQPEDLPDYFSAELGLPIPANGYGKPGLYALADWHAGHSRKRANHLSEYQGAADSLFERLKLKARRHAFAG
ncbi:MAG: hypothetical protein HY784_07350 [Chloroflexi bacterium]|nr:hypothetical protein [Chloroflexota bacterium]